MTRWDTYMAFEERIDGFVVHFTRFFDRKSDNCPWACCMGADRAWTRSDTMRPQRLYDCLSEKILGGIPSPFAVAR